MHSLDLPRGPTRRTLLAGAGAALLLATGCASTASPSPTPHPRLRLIGETRLAPSLPFQGTTVGGLSAIDHDPASGLYYLLSDDRSERGPARFYTARMALQVDRLGPPELLSVVPLQQANGQPYPSRRQASAQTEVPDPEALRWRPGSQTLLWTSEGDLKRGQGPALREIRPDGTLLRELPLPAMFRSQLSTLQGPRHNLTFEGLAPTPDRTGVWVAMEAALRQDGPVPAVGRPGGPCRFTLFDLGQGQALRQIAYVPDAIPEPPVPADAFADNGVSEILMLDAHRLLVLERAYMSGVGNSLRLYRIDTREASDTLALPVLQPGNHRPAPKTLVADFSSLGLSRLDNTEGMTWGPTLPNGRRTLVVVSDDNFNSGQITQFAAFEFIA